MIQVQLKLKLRPAQERMLNRWLWHLTGVYNWALKKIERDAANGIYHGKFGFNVLLGGHTQRMGIPSVALKDMASEALNSWRRCFQRLAKRPRLKGQRNRLNYIAFSRGIGRPAFDRIRVVGAGIVKFHRQDIPPGDIRCGRIVRRASGWYLCLTIAAEPNAIPIVGHAEVGIDPGFSSLVALSTGEKIEHPKELQRTGVRLAQAQSGRNRRLTAKLHERGRNQRKNRNHHLSRRMVSENALIAWSKDSHRSLARTYGKSVASAAHGQLKTMLAYKSSSCGRLFIEVSNRYSTVTCSTCGQKTGPTGLAGLSVRRWVCGCGAEHDRDVNAAVNTLIAGRGLRHERVSNGPSEISA